METIVTSNLIDQNNRITNENALYNWAMSVKDHALVTKPLEFMFLGQTVAVACDEKQVCKI